MEIPLNFLASNHSITNIKLLCVFSLTNVTNIPKWFYDQCL